MYFIFYCIKWILKALRATQEMASFDLNHLHMKAPSVSQFFFAYVTLLHTTKAWLPSPSKQ